ncbi:MAG: hypothetical protein HY564_01980 [Candidatus Jacksonbacteria bacterium]|nr:hypothetical protein [Candidatus Jacksonbacteria bacterium]
MAVDHPGFGGLENKEVKGPFSYEEALENLKYVIESNAEPQADCELLIQEALEKKILTEEQAEALRQLVEDSIKEEMERQKQF